MKKCTHDNMTVSEAQSAVVTYHIAEGHVDYVERDIMEQSEIVVQCIDCGWSESYPLQKCPENIAHLVREGRKVLKPPAETEFE